jgi:predicted DNA-binding transcriptional regulator AlpA
VPLLIEPLLSRADLARVLSVSLRSLDRLQSSGRLPQPDLFLGVRQPRWKSSTVRQWIENGGQP